MRLYITIAYVVMPIHTRLKSQQRVLLCSTVTEAVHLQQNTINAQANERVSLFAQEDVGDDIKGQDCGCRSQLDDIAEEHIPWCQNLGEVTDDFDKGTDCCEKGHSDISCLPSVQRVS